MPNHGKYPDELRDRAVRMVVDHQHEYGSEWEAICSVADKLGPRSETVRSWIRQAETDQGRRPGVTSDEQAELKQLNPENAELRRANDMAISTPPAWSGVQSGKATGRPKARDGHVEVIRAIKVARRSAVKAPLFEAFAKLQERSGVSFPVPVDLTDEEWSAVSQAAAWLSPEKVQYTWAHQDMTITPTNTKALRDLFRPEGGSLTVTTDVSLEFRDRQLQLGRLVRTFQAKTVDGQQTLDNAIARGDDELHIRLEPAGSDVAYEWLMTPDEVPA